MPMTFDNVNMYLHVRDLRDALCALVSPSGLQQSTLLTASSAQEHSA